MRFCISISDFTSLAFLVVCLCFVWFRWLGMKASGVVWLADIYLPYCGALVDIFDIYLSVAAPDIFSWLWCPVDIFHAYLCGCPLIYICLAVVPLLILSSSTVWISLALYPVGAPVWQWVPLCGCQVFPPHIESDGCDG